jgi:Fe2+ or Zn2+ uptake regulation protein
MEKYNITELLKNKKIKKTIQRMHILETINNKGHITFEELRKEIQLKVPIMSLSTIYLNIDFLLKNQIINKLNINKNTFFEIKGTHHFHIITENGLEDKYISKEEEEKLKKILNIENIENIDIFIKQKI